MVHILRFSKRMNVAGLLEKYNGIVGIQSEVKHDATYCISDGKFAILCGDGVVYCLQEDMIELAEMMHFKIKQEIYEIIEVWGDMYEGMHGLRKKISWMS